MKNIFIIIFICAGLLYSQNIQSQHLSVVKKRNGTTPPPPTYVEGGHFISPNGSNTSPYNTWAKACTNPVLAGFWSAVSAGDTVWVDGGASGLTYTTFSTITKNGTSGSRITISGGVSSGHNGVATLDASGRLQGFVIDGIYLTVRNLKFTDAGGSTSGYEIIRVNGDYVYVTNNTIIYPVSKGIRCDVGVGIKILSNYFDTGAISNGAESDGIWLGNNGGNIEIAYNTILMRNTVAGPHKDCIQTYGWQQSASTSLMTSSIHHNFFYSAGAGMVSNTILEGGGIGGYWYFYNNIVVYYRENSGRALSVGLCSEAPYQSYPLYAHFFNNTIYCSGEGSYAFQTNFTDSLFFENNIVRVTPNSIYQPMAIDENCRTGGYMHFNYNQYVVTNVNDFGYENYNTDLGNCDNTSARSVTWATWRGAGYGSQDANSELSNSDASLDFVGAGFPYTGTQIPSMVPADYALDVGSTGVDEGTTISIVTDDYNGVARPQNGTYDVGAFER